MRILRFLEKSLLLLGVALLGFAAFAFVAGRISSHMALERLQSESHAQQAPRIAPEQAGLLPVDFRLWSENRIHQYEASIAQAFDEPIGVLTIESIQLEVPVFNGTEERVLNRGVGRILGTAWPGQPGNFGIAGHRDGFFRKLKDVKVGETLQLSTKSSTQAYTIDSITIVLPDDVSVLKNDNVPSLTLVTCFPFYFIGSAPQRYVVHAALNDSSKSTTTVKASLKSTEPRTKEKKQ